MPHARGLGDYSMPAEFIFQDVRVRQINAIRRAKLNKIAVSFEFQFTQHKQILPDLRPARLQGIDCLTFKAPAAFFYNLKLI